MPVPVRHGEVGILPTTTPTVGPVTAAPHAHMVAGGHDEIALCQAACWGAAHGRSSGLNGALCLDKRQYVVGERIVLCMRDLPGLQATHTSHALCTQ